MARSKIPKRASRVGLASIRMIFSVNFLGRRAVGLYLRWTLMRAWEVAGGASSRSRWAAAAMTKMMHTRMKRKKGKTLMRFIAVVSGDSAVGGAQQGKEVGVAVEGIQAEVGRRGVGEVVGLRASGQAAPVSMVISSAGVGEAVEGEEEVGDEVRAGGKRYQGWAILLRQQKRVRGDMAYPSSNKPTLAGAARCRLIPAFDDESVSRFEAHTGPLMMS